MKTLGDSANKTQSMVYIAICAVLIAVCSWITIPATIPFTLQTFGVFLTVCLLGGKRGSLSVFIYIVLGLIGIPVFAGVKGGIGVLLGNTGGYIIGFLFSALIMWAMEALLGRKTWVLAASMVIGLIACYAVGTAWFMMVYTSNSGQIGLMTVLGWCVIPFIIPDFIKMALALCVYKQLAKRL